MKKRLALLRQEKGQAAAEYGPLLVFVGIMAMVALSLFGEKIRLMFEQLATSL